MNEHKRYITEQRVLTVLIEQDGLCMDVPEERVRLSKAIALALHPEPKPVEVVKKVTETERKVLECLAENSRRDGEMCITFSWIVDDTKLTLAQVRRSCRALRKKGLAEFYRGLMTEDGEAAGSGYSITRAGESVISPCDVCGEPATYEYDGKRECEDHYKQSPKADQKPLL